MKENIAVPSFWQHIRKIFVNATSDAAF